MRTLFALAFSVASWAQQYEMTTYHLVLLQKGPAWTRESTPESKKLQEGHMANIRKMAESGKLVVAGPIASEHNLRGIFIFASSSIEEVREWCAQDPAVKAGRLTVDVYPWYAAKGLKVDPPK
jgi:uncharacterized protein YciI